MATICIVTPTYNHARFIRSCIDSVLNQTVSDWEMWIIDDGSDDGTADIAESYRDPRINVLRRSHAGLSRLGGAYAAALERSSAPLVAVIEGDDVWPATKLANQIPLFDDEAVVLAYGPAGLVDENGCVYARFWSPPQGTDATNVPVGSVLPALLKGNFLVSSTVMVRRASLDRIGGFIQPPGVPYVDHPTWLKLATIGAFAPSSSIVGYWRRHAQQFTTSSLASEPPDLGSFLRGLAIEAREAGLPPTLAELLESTANHDTAPQKRRAMVGQARLALLHADWAEAGKLWRSLLSSGHAPTITIAAAGLVASAAHTDVEWAFRRRGRLSWPSRRHLASRAHQRRQS